MNTLWELLLQTLNVSTVALFILIVKRIFNDKLSPRWQFSVWGLVLISVLIPAGIAGRVVLIPWAQILEMLKIVLFHDYSLMHIPLPVILLKSADPAVVICAAGTVIMGLIYLNSYFRLKRLVSKGTQADPQTLQLVRDTAVKYHLSSCPVKVTEGISSAFIFGVIHPVLVLPQGQTVQELVILHELLHYQHRDPLWSVVIAAVRCLHWFNPFLWYCCNEAGNDLESLCDQRVLETVEGEQRREYGKILLSMVNEKYARAAGTSSLANGGRNISRRIEAIVRFKQYPKGMQLVSVCILMIMSFPLCVGARSEVPSSLTELYSSKPEAYRIIAMARTQSCSTPEGALDTYAKTLLSQSTAYRILCAPEEDYQFLLQQRERNYLETGVGTYTTGLKRPAANVEGYSVLNPVRLDDSTIRATVMIQLVPDVSDSDGQIELAMQRVQVENREGRWVVVPVENFEYLTAEQKDIRYSGIISPQVCELYTARSELFEIELSYQIRFYSSQNEIPVWMADSFDEGTVYDPQPLTGMKYDRSEVFISIDGIYTGNSEQRKELKNVDIVVRPMIHEQDCELPELTEHTAPQNMSSSTGLSISHTEIPLESDDRLTLTRYGYTDHVKGLDHRMPAGFIMDLYINGEKTDSLILTPQKR